MKVLMISTDRKIFEESSAVRQRVLEYGNLVDELKIIIFNSSTKFSYGYRIPGSNVILYPTNSINRFFYVFDGIRIGLKLKLNKNWLITTQDPFETGLVGAVISGKLKTKLQFQIHTDFLSKYFTKESVLNRIRVIIAKFLLPKADGVRVVSGRIKRSIIGRGLIKDSNKIIVSPVFIDIEKIKNSQPSFDLRQKYPQFDFVFLVASRLEKEKNVNLIIDSFREVVKKYPRIGLIIVGEGSQKRRLENLVQDYSLQNNVFFEGWQNNLIGYYKTSDLFLSTSSYEGFGMSLVESIVSGCPVLTTNVGIVGEILTEENSLICNINDEDCFVDKMICAIENKEKIRKMNEKAQQEIEKNLIVNKQKYLEEHKESFNNCLNN